MLLVFTIILSRNVEKAAASKNSFFSEKKYDNHEKTSFLMVCHQEN